MCVFNCTYIEDSLSVSGDHETSEVESLRSENQDLKKTVAALQAALSATDGMLQVLHDWP